MLHKPICELEGVRMEGLHIHDRPDYSGDDGFGDLAEYWDIARGHRDVPLRSDIDPIDLKQHLGSLFIADYIPDKADFRLRLVGTFLTERYGIELTGRTLRESFSAIDETFCDAAIASMIRTLSEKTWFRGGGTIISARNFRINFEVLQMPLSSSGQRADMILGKWAYAGQS
jgi:hypothetical protein